MPTRGANNSQEVFEHVGCALSGHEDVQLDRLERAVGAVVDVEAE